MTLLSDEVPLPMIIDLTVDKQTYMVGNDCPKEEEQECLTPDDEAPKGKMARGRYRVKSSFSVDDKNVYLNWE
ncbi:hypothetical protein KUCAC02_007491 [Chaenocephalus aceratus]|uniref:Uncharacterized protein n=1 Tax=Chaenocephalus aceratus TaxID=36190 RepID=A0ACB9X5L7_CHAAC|nr:hypothetical protein KUCAC02_007491 [Chaenocephalus aceratus]